MFFFFFNDTATTEIYTLSLHDALPIFAQLRARVGALKFNVLLSPDQTDRSSILTRIVDARNRSEEHTSELQSLTNLVCRLLLEKKKKTKRTSSRLGCYSKILRALICQT